MASTAFTDLVTVIQASWLKDVDTSTYGTLNTIAGGNTITANGPVSLTAYQRGQRFFFVPAANNVAGAVTLNINGLGPKAITKYGAGVLQPGDLVAGVAAAVLYDGAEFQFLTVRQDTNYPLTGGTSTAFTATPASPYTLTFGARATFIFHTTNTSSAVTLNVAGTGTIPIKIMDVAGGSSDPGVGGLVSGAPAIAVYNGVNYLVFQEKQPLPVPVPVTSGGTGATSAQGAKFNLLVPAPLQCRLVKVGANLVLQPLDGNYIIINGMQEVIPAAGVSLAPTGATPLTLLYIYAFMSAGVMTLEFSPTVPVVDLGNGVKVKSTDGSRTCVGMARPIAGPAWQDTPAQRFVLSWPNRRNLATIAFYTAPRSTASAVFVEVNAEIRNEFLYWAGDAVVFHADGQCSHSLANGIVGSTLAVDGTTNLDAASGGQSYGINSSFPMAMTGEASALTEGYHYITLLGFQGGGGTATWTGAGAPNQRTSLKGFIQG
jgi:hypothetical protein